MKKVTKIFAIGIIALGFATTSFAQNGVTATASTSATIITPISISKSIDMDFGNVAVSPTIAGTVKLATTNARTAVGGVTLPATTGTVSAAKFTVTGLSGSTYSISMPTTITLTSGTHTMTVNAFNSTPTSTGTLTAGTQDIMVGATLNVGAGQAAGTYTNATGLFVTVNYN